MSESIGTAYILSGIKTPSLTGKSQSLARLDKRNINMFAKVLLCCFAAIAASAPVEEYPPQPYSFSFDNTDEFGTRLTREETSDANNFKVGSYSYIDATGVTRTVRYTADADGFHATVETNEPGTKTSGAADALYSSSAVEVGPEPTAVVAKPVAAVAPVKPVPVAAVRPVPVAAVRPIPVAAAPVPAHAVHAIPIATVASRPVAFAHRVVPVPIGAYPFGKAKSA